MKKWFHDKDRNISALRIMVVPAGYIGMAMSLSGLVAMYLQNGQATVAMTTGAGLITAAMAAKAWQKGKE